MSNPVNCFLPCRKGSERVPRKNIKPFAGFEFGLIEIKLKQLLQTARLDQILLSTNDEEILDYASGLKESRIQLHHRADSLSSGTTSTDQLVGHALDLIGDGHILWTHVTSPFVNSHVYDQVISSYIDKLNQGYDSLMTTTPLHGFLWQQGQPLNYDRKIEKWPRTQTLAPVHEVNSAIFLASTRIYEQLGDRIGKRPFLYELDKLTSHDIDWPEDFVIAECMAEKNLVVL